MRILGLVFTQGMSLDMWVKQGLIEREKQIYEEHLKEGHFDRVVWFTYGKNDKEVRSSLIESGQLDQRIVVVPMPAIFRKGGNLYSYLLPVIKAKECKRLCIIKTNQMGGAWTADIIHRLYGTPFVLRTGYTYSSFIKNKTAEISKKYAKWKMNCKYTRYRKIENKLYHRCDVAMVSSVHDKQYICDSYGVPENKVGLLTNYIDCELFYPMPDIDKKDRFIFVGRLEPQKNLFNLLEALGQLHKGIDIYGEGSLKPDLEYLAGTKGYDVCFKGVVGNRELAKIYNEYMYYILPSLYEGMPKTLLEAMACGLICTGTAVEGIREVIKDRQNGYLIKDTSVDSIKEAINHMDITIHDRISQNAVTYVQEKHSLRTITSKEWEVMQNLL